MKYALIVGAYGGLASQIIDTISNDYIIFAIDKNPLVINKYENIENIYPFVCDITDKNNVLSIKEKVKEITNNINLIINFAGVVILGSTLEIDSEKALNVLKVNVMGMYNVNQIFIDMLDTTSRIINVSSEYGVLDALPFHSFYTMSKHAVEIYNDSLRRELNFKGIKVIKIRPGAFKTNMQGNIINQFEELVNETKMYKKPLMKMKHIMVKELDKAKDTKKIVKVFKKAIYKKHPRISYNVNNSFKMKLLSSLPDTLQDKVLKIYFK